MAAVLPGALRYWLLGSRPGVMLAIRNQLLRQRATEVMTSDIVPVQHRAPRPVPLPDNNPNRPDVALQTWASHFEPSRTVNVSDTPGDEAFLADYRDANNSVVFAKQLKVTLVEPVRGEITSKWNGRFKLTVNPENRGSELTSAVAVNCRTFDCVPNDRAVIK